MLAKAAARAGPIEHEERPVPDAPNDWRLGKQSHDESGKICWLGHPAQYNHHLSSQFSFTGSSYTRAHAIPPLWLHATWLILVKTRGKHD
jgi:hypothetical protein